MIQRTMLGILAGIVFGVALGYFLAPTPQPGERLRHEWYTMAVFGYVFWSCVGSVVLGSVVGACPRREAIWLTSLGLLIGLIVGYIAWDNGLAFSRQNRQALPHDPYSGFTIISITFGMGILGAIVGSIWSRQRRASQPVVTSEETVFRDDQ